ncbi:MAG: LOG family protein, partial [Actinomycetia bacterium]|nr:LOG family protein [Actinomycetes bacterium]
GTLEEVFEVFTWGQLGLHAKPTALFDVGSFYAPLLDQLRRMVEQGYLRDAFLDALGIVHDADELVKFVADYRHPHGKWAAAAER